MATAGPVKFGISFFKNVNSGESGASLDVNLGFASYTLERDTPVGGLFGGTGGDLEQIFSVGKMRYNITTGEKDASLAKTVKVGAQGIVGLEVSLNPTKFKQLGREKAACEGQAY